MKMYQQTENEHRSQGIQNLEPEHAFLLLWPWPWTDDLHIVTWPVSPEDVPADQKWTFYIKAFIVL